MTRSARGLYESLLTEALAGELAELSERLEVRRAPLHEAEAADRLALHVARVLERAVRALEPKQRVVVGAALARRIIELCVEAANASALAAEAPVEPLQLLVSVLERLPDGRAEELRAPLIPLLDTALLTNAPGEPRVGHQLLTEIHSAGAISRAPP